ncbi:hypothetical protein GGI15_001609 [Coemansia interrupta]|uniref:Cullin family profile domain-containing protein n=1 Tax=Coemansia interrupta TaxID=1126814 RepID=A0A9W8HJG6_9FUNG|nr:hypothetical protein GGI15_001609 [Coemansia interrupta]
MSYANKRPGGRIMPARRLTPHVDPEKQFEKISQAIEEIYKHNASQLSFEELYRTAYGLVLSKNGPMLYSGVKQVLESHLKDRMYQDIYPHIDAAGGRPTSGACEALLASVRLLWSEHVTAMLVIKDVLMYVDKVYVKAAQLPTIYEMGMCVFRDQVLLASNQLLSNKVVDAIMFQILHERVGAGDVNRDTLRGVVNMMIELQDPRQLRPMYDVCVEKRLLAETGVYYADIARMRISEMGAPEYLRVAQANLDTELERAKDYLSPSTTPALTNSVLENLIEAYTLPILKIPNAGLIDMLDQRDTESLYTLYRLYKPFHSSMQVLRTCIYDHTLELGKKIMLGVESSSENTVTGGSPKPATDVSGIAARTAMALRWVQEVLSCYDVYDMLLKQSFADDQDMRNTIKDAFIEIINANARAPELLSLFIDDNLKNGLRRKTEQEIDHLLERCVLMFRFLKNKDTFEHYYKLHLAKRLLFGRSLSDDSEQSLVSKLKVECGSQFTLKLEGMFKDMQLSSDVNRELRESSIGSDLGFDLNVSVLTPTFWPTMASSGASSGPRVIAHETGTDNSGTRGSGNRDANNGTKAPASSGILIPSTGGISTAIEKFTSHYLKFHSGRRLTWQYGMGNADLKVHFRSRTHELNVSTYQMIILMLFVDGEQDISLTAEQIHIQTRIPFEPLARHLQSLACGKYKVLIKTPMSREISPSDVFVFNSGFKSPQYRIRIPVISARNNVETEQEKEASQAAIGQERQYVIEAAVVRIMKTRRQMTHEQLVNETVDQLSARFMASPKMIKSGIEKLIDREYLQRSADDPRLYLYLA